MNDAWGYDNNDNTGLDNNSEANGPKALRDAYEAMKRQNDELNQKLTSFLEDQQKSKVASVFESLGVPGAAELYQGEPDPEKAKAWVETMKATFGNGSAQGDSVQTATNTQSVLDTETQEQFQKMLDSGANAGPIGNIEAAAGAVGSANSIQDLIAISQQTQHLR